jgi:hypothetical protein
VSNRTHGICRPHLPARESASPLYSTECWLWTHGRYCRADTRQSSSAVVYSIVSWLPYIRIWQSVCHIQSASVVYFAHTTKGSIPVVTHGCTKSRFNLFNDATILATIKYARPKISSLKSIWWSSCLKKKMFNSFQKILWSCVRYHPTATSRDLNLGKRENNFTPDEATQYVH